jgi:hypothetical protein
VLFIHGESTPLYASGMQSMVLVILGLKASDNMAFWTYRKKKNLYLLSKLGYQKKNLCLLKALSLSFLGNQTIAYLNKNFILLLPHFGFLFFNLSKIYLYHLLHFQVYGIY